MEKRALLIGSQTGGLTGVHGDIEVLADALAALGFEVRRQIEAGASSTAIVDAYRALVADSAADDAAVVYYSGHGGRMPNVQRAADPSQPPHVQWIVPTDIDDRGDGFNGILAEELSALQWQLTERTRNVTTILDCCHSSRMFRDPDIVPKADRRTFPWDDVAARWARVRAAGDIGVGDVNPHAVQLVACEPDQSAYEMASSSIGGTHGALTAELVAVLRRPDVGRLSWREAIEIIRPAVLDVIAVQRPDILGEKSARDRIMFSTEVNDASGVLGVGRDGTTAWLERPALFGVAAGDRYRLVAPGADPRTSTWIADVERVDGDRALLTLRGVAASELPAGVLAHPLETALGRRPVAVRPPDHPDRERVVAALRTSPHVRVGDGHGEVIATVELDDGGARILDVAGEPLQATAQPLTDATLAALDDALRRLSRATQLRDLDSGADAAALADDVGLLYRRLVDGQEVEVAAGEHVYDGDRLVVRATNRSAETRYVTVLDVGLTGGVTILTPAQPSGTTMAAGQEVIVGENAAHTVEGVELYWPDHLPRGGPRPESFITIVADEPIDSLPALAQSGVATRAATRGDRSAIDLLLENVAVGTRDVRLPASAAKQTRYRVHRLDLVLHPTPRPAADGEPAFEIDDRPDPSFRLVAPRAATTPPGHVTVRISDLVVHSDRSFLTSGVRVDFLVLTAAAEGTQPFRAETFVVDRARGGDRLPFGTPLVYDGPVTRFLDLAVWVSRGDGDGRPLTDLLSLSLEEPEVAGAVATLAALAVAAPPAAVVAASMAAVGTLVRTSADLIRAEVGESIGIYRTSFLPHERFGAGDPVRRHPEGGLLRAQDMSLAFEVIDATP